MQPPLFCATAEVLLERLQYCHDHDGINLYMLPVVRFLLDDVVEGTGGFLLINASRLSDVASDNLRHAVAAGGALAFLGLQEEHILGSQDWLWQEQRAKTAGQWMWIDLYRYVAAYVATRAGTVTEADLADIVFTPADEKHGYGVARPGQPMAYGWPRFNFPILETSGVCMYVLLVIIIFGAGFIDTLRAGGMALCGNDGRVRTITGELPFQTGLLKPDQDGRIRVDFG